MARFRSPAAAEVERRAGPVADAAAALGDDDRAGGVVPDLLAVVRRGEAQEQARVAAGQRACEARVRKVVALKAPQPTFGPACGADELAPLKVECPSEYRDVHTAPRDLGLHLCNSARHQCRSRRVTSLGHAAAATSWLGTYKQSVLGLSRTVFCLAIEPQWRRRDADCRRQACREAVVAVPRLVRLHEPAAAEVGVVAHRHPLLGHAAACMSAAS